MIGDRIKSARQALGYSAEQVAEFLQVSPATVYRYENGDISKLPSKFIKPLADFLCVSPGYLMGWTPDNEQPSQEQAPKTVEARVISRGIDSMPKEQREAIVKLMTGLYPGLFEKGSESDGT